MISGFSDVSMSPKTNMIYLWRPQDTSTIPRKIQIRFEVYYFQNLKILELQHFDESIGKDVHRTIPAIRLRISWRSLMWDQSLPENEMKSKFGKHSKLCNIWHTNATYCTIAFANILNQMIIVLNKMVHPPVTR